MTDINKLIEEEAEKYADNLHPLYVQSLTLEGKYYWKDHFKTGFKKGASFILHQNRWRKVSEELPEVREKDYQVLGLLKNGEYKTIWVIKDSIPQIEVFAYHGVTEWKPIE